MRLPLRLLAVVVAGAWLAACATQTEPPSALSETGAGAGPAAQRSIAAIPPAPGGYKLTPAETKLDCAKLTGQMKVRAASMRAAFAQSGGSSISRTAQQVVTPVMGGTKRGADPEADLQLDRAKLEAFNARLAEKKCKPLDIDAELRGDPPPAPPAKAPAKAS